MKSGSVVALLALAGAVALVQSACFTSKSGVAPGAEVPNAGSGGTAGSSLDASPWPEAAPNGGTSTTGFPDAGGSGPGGSGGKGTSGSNAGGSSARDSGTGGSSARDSGTGGSSARDSGTGGSDGGCSSKPELCNNIDDNCNGQIDENLSRYCTTTCGSGSQICHAGQWGTCSAPQPQTCMDYSTCKMVQQCTCPSKPAEKCDLADDDCNGQCDDGAGCRVGVYRSYNSSNGEHFYTTSSTEAACCGFTVEFPDYYYLYKSQVSTTLVPFYRCLLSSGMHFYTTSSNCEGSVGSKVEGTLGYIAKSAVCGAIPLYRLSAGNGDHLYTTSSSERQSAIGGGYTYEGIAGYVWQGP